MRHDKGRLYSILLFTLLYLTLAAACKTLYHTAHVRTDMLDMLLKKWRLGEVLDGLRRAC